MAKYEMNLEENEIIQTKIQEKLETVSYILNEWFPI